MNKKVLIISSSPRKGGNSETLLDRANPLYDTDYAFTKAYLLATAAENEPETVAGTEKAVQGWVDCFERAELKGCIFGGGINAAGEAVQHAEAMQQAYDLGRNV